MSAKLVIFLRNTLYLRTTLEKSERAEVTAIRMKCCKNVLNWASPPEYAAPPSCLGETSDGAPIIRSSARWFIEKQHHYAQILLAAQRHDDAVDAGRSGFTPACSRAEWRAAARSRSR